MTKLHLQLSSLSLNLTELVILFCCFIFAVFALYNLLLALAGFLPQRRYAEAKKQHRFAALISARNEEQVLPYLLRSIRGSTYPQELIDIIVIADNCSDSTAEAARQEGALVLERFDTVHIGKGHALKWAFDRILSWPQRYDAFCIFDADNLVHPTFFDEMNRVYDAGGRLAQGYRNSKNAGDNWISAAYSCFYWAQNRFFNRARSALGLSASINGTGFMIAREIIAEQGWPTQTITEDIETTVLNVLDDRPTWWAGEAIVYDEQPLGFCQSWRQRKRWSAGNWQCFQLYGSKLLGEFIRKPRLQYLDTFLFLLPLPLTLLSLFLTISQFAYTVIASLLPARLVSSLSLLEAFRAASPLIDTVVSFLISPLGVVVVGLISYLMVVTSALLAIFLENRQQTGLLILKCFLYPLFLFSWIGINCLVLFGKRTQPQWTPIAHVRTVSIESVLGSKDTP